MDNYNTMASYREVTERRLGEIGRNPFEAARTAGLERGFLNDIVNERKKSVQGENFRKLAKALEWDPATLTRALEGDWPSGEGIPNSVREGAYRPPPEFIGQRDLPVYASAEGGPGEMVIDTDPIDFVPRPWYLKNVKEGFAVVLVGESMEPRYTPGEIIIVNPKAPLIKGKDCLVHTAKEGGDFRAAVKIYSGMLGESWRLRQLNPEKEIVLKKHEWPFCIRVVGRWDGG